MKLNIVQTGTPGTVPTLELRCERLTAELRRTTRSIEALLSRSEGQITVRSGGTLHILSPAEVLYMESVDDLVFVYTAAEQFPTALTLAAAAERFGEQGLLRAGKSLVINLHHIQKLERRMSGGLEATLDNGERVYISRRYTAALRSALTLF